MGCLPRTVLLESDEMDEEDRSTRIFNVTNLSLAMEARLCSSSNREGVWRCVWTNLKAVTSRDIAIRHTYVLYSKLIILCQKFTLTSSDAIR